MRVRVYSFRKLAVTTARIKTKQILNNTNNATAVTATATTTTTATNTTTINNNNYYYYNALSPFSGLNVVNEADTMCTTPLYAHSP